MIYRKIVVSKPYCFFYKINNDAVVSFFCQFCLNRFNILMIFLPRHELERIVPSVRRVHAVSRQLREQLQLHRRRQLLRLCLLRRLQDRHDGKHFQHRIREYVIQ